MNTEDGKLIEDKEKVDSLITIGKFLESLQDKYGLNDFNPTDITLSKIGDTIFAKVVDYEGEIILNRWVLDEFKIPLFFEIKS